MPEQPSTAGVQELIDKLSQDGVAEGQRQADELVEKARKQADEIVEAARRRAKEIVDQGREEAAQFQAAGEAALQLASRDAIRDLSAKIHEGYRGRLQELVSHEMKDPQLIRQMILEIARKATEGAEGEKLELLLPEQIIDDKEARRRIDAGEEDALNQFVSGLIGEDLRSRQEFGVQHAVGLTVRVVDRKVEIDLTDEAITEILAKYTLPRFRAILRRPE